MEGFELEMGPWSVLGNKALSSASYVPDFTAVRGRLLVCFADSKLWLQVQRAEAQA